MAFTRPRQWSGDVTAVVWWPILMLNEVLQSQHHGADMHQFKHRFVVRVHGIPTLLFFIQRVERG